MSLLPIVDRELRTTARRHKTYWLRLAAALAAAAICAWVCLWTGRAMPPATLGPQLFAALTVLAFGYCLLVGPFITADCISEEKRDGTLGLLFLTDLRSYDVVLGKWVATSLAGFYGLLAILPALGLPLLMGGVTPAEYGRVALGVVNAILFSLTAGIFVSTFCRDQTKATFGSVLLILGITGLIPGLIIFFATVVGNRPLNQLPAVALASPAYTGYLALEASYRAAPKNFWTSLAIVHAFSWLFMIGTAIWVPRVWRESPEGKPTVHRWLWRFGYTAGWRRAFRRRLEKNPIFALAARLRWPHLVFWGLVSIVAINVYWLTYGYRRSPGSHQFHVYFSHALVFTNRVWITAMACRFFLEARRTGALELLLTTPLPVRTLLRGHWRALRHMFLLPVLVIALLHVGYVYGSWKLSAGNQINPGLLQYYIAAAAGSLINFVTDVFALCWVGAWLSLSSRKATLAVLKTYGYVILIPWIVAHFFPALQTILPQKLMLYATGHPWLQKLLAYPLLTYYTRPICWVTKNVVFILWASYKLRKHFRAAAAQTYNLERWHLPRWRPFSGAKRPSVASLSVAETMLPDAGCVNPKA